MPWVQGRWCGNECRKEEKEEMKTKEDEEEEEVAAETSGFLRWVCDMVPSAARRRRRT